MSKAKTINRILVPLELNSTGESLLTYAGQLALACGAELLLFHACKSADLTDTQHSRCIQTLRTFGEHVLRRVQKPGGAAVPFDCVVRPGKISDSIDRVAETFAADLVVMEAYPLPGEEHREEQEIHAAAIMELVSCPVLAVPATAQFKKPEQLVFATDFTDQDKLVLQQLTGFAKQLNAKLILVHLYTKEDRPQLCNIKTAMLALEKQLQEAAVDFKLLEEEDLLEGISDFAEAVSADMLVLGTQDNFLVTRLFSNNYIKTLAYHTRIPLLAYRQNKLKPCSGCCGNCASKHQEQQELAISKLIS